MKATTRSFTGACVAALLLLAPVASHAGRAKLLDAQWETENLPPGSAIEDDRHTLVTPLSDPPVDLVAHATLTFDVSRGDDGILSFLSDHSWLQCEAPDGLIVGASGTVAVVCQAPAAQLARLKKKTRVYIKVDPPGGGAHRKLYWELRPSGS